MLRVSGDRLAMGDLDLDYQEESALVKIVGLCVFRLAKVTVW